MTRMVDQVRWVLEVWDQRREGFSGPVGWYYGKPPKFVPRMHGDVAQGRTRPITPSGFEYEKPLGPWQSVPSFAAHSGGWA